MFRWNGLEQLSNCWNRNLTHTREISYNQTKYSCWIFVSLKITFYWKELHTLWEVYKYDLYCLIFCLSVWWMLSTSAKKIVQYPSPGSSSSNIIQEKAWSLLRLFIYENEFFQILAKDSLNMATTKTWARLASNRLIQLQGKYRDTAKNVMNNIQPTDWTMI